MNIEALRKLAGREEVDYLFLLSALKDYLHPRDKITTWLKKGELIRVKKGLYVFGKHVALEPFSHEVLANLIYGPSAISLNYALAYYGLIPEKVELITSITNKRNKLFETPVGRFAYYYLSTEKYAPGIELSTAADKTQFLLATPEKALCDQIYLIEKKLIFAKPSDVANYLFHDIRFDETGFKNLKVKQLQLINSVYKQPKLETLIQFRKQWE